MLNPAPNAFSELYSAYAAGCLDPALALLVETQAALRADVATSLAQAELIAGVMLEQESAAAMKDNALDAALAAIDALPPLTLEDARHAANKASGAIEEILALPEPLRGKAIEAAGETGWQFNAPGIKRLRLACGGEAEAELYRIEPGASTPRHTHKGFEATLVAAGGFSDETGSFGPGDVSLKGPDDTHQPVADPGEPCFALAVRDGGLRFTGAMGLIQRVLGA